MAEQENADAAESAFYVQAEALAEGGVDILWIETIFAFDELAARVRSLLRRAGGRSGSVLAVGPLVLDTARHEARRGDRLIDLTAKEFALLRYFMSRPGEVISQEELLDHVWDEHADPFTNTVRVTVGTLRRKLSTDDESGLLETVVGRGYRLLEEVPGP